MAGALGGVAVAALAPSLQAAAAPATATSAVGSDPFPGLPRTTTFAQHLARRATICPTPAIVASIESLGLTRWLDRQLNPWRIDDRMVEGLIARHYPVVTMTRQADVEAYTRGAAGEAAPALQRVTALRQVFGNRHLLESMTEFFSDQVYVGIHDKANHLVADFNETVLRRHALGKFSDLLYASLTNPAMLFFLDNVENSKYGINENLGRELLELHTVGVGNYTEEDVRNCALLLTGHQYDWDAKTYIYRPDQHHVGPLRIMGFTDPNTDAAAGPALLRRFCDHLATHPATARRLARRLCVRFVSDAPSDAVIDAVAATYLKSGSAMGPTLRALFGHPEFAQSVGLKARRGQEFTNGLLRLMNPRQFVPANDPRTQVWDTMGSQMWVLDLTGHLPRAWPHVDGYPDQAADWVNSNMLRGQWNTAEVIVNGWSKEFPLPPLAETFGFTVGEDLRAAVERLTLHLTGWKWALADIDVIAATLNDLGTTVPTAGAKVTDATVTRLAFAVRAVACSPYFLMR